MLATTPHRLDEPLAKHTTWRIGGPARVMAFPETLAHLEEISTHLRSSGEPYAVLGNGSNLLVPDEGFPGLVIKTSRLPGFVQFGEGGVVHVGCSVLNAKVVRACAEQGLAGLEFLAGVPGSIGGAVAMNAGTDEGWVDQVVSEVRTYCLERGLQRYERESLRFEYRRQLFMRDSEIVLEAFFALRTDSVEAIKQRIQTANKRRREAQPIDMPSCGSVFKNPPGKSAWKLIDEAGLRGTQKGGAQISDKHTNFIINSGGAKMQDVLFLIRLAKEAVSHQFGIELEEEVRILTPKFLAAANSPGSG